MVGAATTLVVGTAGLVLATVLQAERQGTQALEQLQVAQVQQLTRSMDTRMKGAFESIQGLVSGPAAWNARRSDPSDARRLAQLQALNSKARTGLVIVDTSGTVTNGTLLRDETAVGRRVDRPGLDAVLRSGKPAILPVGPGMTSALPTIVFAFPLRSSSDAPVGGFLFESEVAPDSAFNSEVAQLKPGRTGDFSFVDVNDVVVASSDPGMIGRKLDEPLLADGRVGFHRGDGRVAVTENVPTAGWRTVFRQDAEEFEGALTGPLRSALIFVVLAGALCAGVAMVLLSRRLRRAREEQRRLEEINAVREEFISIVSHELRTPVAGLLGFLQTTLDHWDAMTDTERQRAIGRSMASARRLHSLTRDVLDTSTMEAGGLSYAFTVVDLREEVASAVLAIRDLTPERLVSVTVDDRAAWVRADPERVQQVLTNLLDNAVKSSPPLSPVEIELVVRDDVVEVAVNDHGPGLSDMDLSRVFDKFVRGRTTTVGSGLGLYICRQVVEAHGGSIRAESNTGGGARFVFTMPLAPAPAEPVDV